MTQTGQPDQPGAYGRPAGQGLVTEAGQATPAPGPANGFASPPTGAFTEVGPPRPPGAPAPRGAAPATLRPRSGGTGRRRGLVLAVVAALVVVGLVVGGVLWQTGRKDDTAEVPVVTPTTAAPVVVKPRLSSYDPVGGSGFKQSGSTWRTQTYNNADFGGLKDGVGLVLDLGSPRDLASIGFTADTRGFTAELRSADRKPSGISGWDKAGSSTTASGRTTLDAAAAGRHQYWMIWVTELGSSKQAVISGVTVAAKP